MRKYNKGLYLAQKMFLICVRRSVRPSVMIVLRSAKTRISDAAVAIVCVSECVWGWGVDEGMETVDGGYTLLPTRQQRFCDPASLVCRFLLHLSF